MKYGLVLLGAALILGRFAFHLELDKQAAASFLALLILIPVIFVWTVIKNWRYPGRHDEWIREPTEVNDGQARFSVKSKTGTPWAEAHGFDIRSPDGQSFRATWNEPESGFGFYCTFPQDFDGACCLASGEYEIWFLFASGRKRRLRPVISWREEVRAERRG